MCPCDVQEFPPPTSQVLLAPCHFHSITFMLFYTNFDSLRLIYAVRTHLYFIGGKKDPYTLFLLLSLIILSITPTWSFYFTNYVNSSELYSFDSHIFPYHQLSSLFSLGPISFISATDLSYSPTVQFPLIISLSPPSANPKP